MSRTSITTRDLSRSPVKARCGSGDCFANYPNAEKVKVTLFRELWFVSPQSLTARKVRPRLSAGTAATVRRRTSSSWLRTGISAPPGGTPWASIWACTRTPRSRDSSWPVFRTSDNSRAASTIPQQSEIRARCPESLCMRRILPGTNDRSMITADTGRLSLRTRGGGLSWGAASVMMLTAGVTASQQAHSLIKNIDLVVTVHQE